LLGASSLLLLLASACVVVQPELQITPEPIPTEVLGAHWSEPSIPYCIVSEGEGGFVDHATFVSLVQQAMAAWGVPTTFEGDCAGPITAGNQTNEIGWGSLPGDPGELTEAGETSLSYRAGLRGGPPQIMEADITIEREAARGRDSVECLYTTLLHETGHVFGLPHLGMSTVMAPVITDCLQELTPADRAALAELY
jgi:hypothetical protein